MKTSANSYNEANKRVFRGKYKNLGIWWIKVIFSFCCNLHLILQFQHLELVNTPCWPARWALHLQHCPMFSVQHFCAWGGSVSTKGQDTNTGNSEMCQWLLVDIKKHGQRAKVLWLLSQWEIRSCRRRERLRLSLEGGSRCPPRGDKQDGVRDRLWV